MPSLDVVLAYAGACGADQAEWERRWHQVKAELAGQSRSRGPTAGGHAADPGGGHRVAPEPASEAAPSAAPGPGAGATNPAGDEPLRARLLNVVWRYWIDAELRPALAVTGRLPSQLVEYHAANTLSSPIRPIPRPAVDSSTIRQIFDRSLHLLILGERGSGKTLLLLELARDLITACADDPGHRPMPVVVPLSSWAERREPLDTWLVEQMDRLYGVDQQLGRAWVTSRQVLPLLDGLDEVPPEHRGACVAAINDYQHQRGATSPLVVTCRTDAYQSLHAPLRPRETVEVQSLTLDQVRSHLRSAGPRFAGVLAALDDDPVLADLLTTPLFLAMVTYAYRDRPAAGILGGGHVEGRRQALLGDYVARRLDDQATPKRGLARHPPGYRREEVLRWLSWLARAMRRRNLTVFHPDHMQADLLTRRVHRWLICPGVAIAVGLTALVVFSLLNGFAVYSISGTGARAVERGVLAGVVAGTIVAVLSAWQCLQYRIEPTIPPQRSRSTLARMLVHGAVWGSAGALIGLPFGIWFGTLSARQTLGPLSFLMFGVLGSTLGGGVGGMTAGFVSGLAIGTINSLQPQPNVRPTSPGAAMRETLRVAAGAAAMGLCLGLTTYGLYVGLPFASAIALRLGGAAYLRHHLLRILLVREAAIPHDYLSFLHHAHTMVLLNEIGGGYKFTHPLLHDYFARLDPRTLEPARNA